jgi:GcrA cell cycle regulator
VKAGKARDVLVRESPAPASPRPAEPVKLRCVGISPLLVSLIELKPGDCRYPYGGDKEGEPIVFCGHPRREGSSYCTPHFDLTQAPEAETERPAARVLLRLVEAA